MLTFDLVLTFWQLRSHEKIRWVPACYIVLGTVLWGLAFYFYLHHATSWHVRISHLYTSTSITPHPGTYVSVIFTLLPPSRHILARTYQSSLHFYLHHATSWHHSHLYTSTSITPHPGTYVSQSSLQFYLHHATSWHVRISHLYTSTSITPHPGTYVSVIFTLLPPSRHILARMYHSHLYTSTSITPHPGTYVSQSSLHFYLHHATSWHVRIAVIFTLLPPSRHILARTYHSHLYTSTSITPHPGTYVSQSSLHFYLHHATSWHVRITVIFTLLPPSRHILARTYQSSLHFYVTPHPGTYVSVIFTLLPPSRHILARTYQSSLHFYLHHATSWHVRIAVIFTLLPPSRHILARTYQSSLHFYLHHATSWHVRITVIFTLLPPSRHILARTYHSHLYTSTSITPHPGTYVSQSSLHFYLHHATSWHVRITVIFTLLPPSRHILARTYQSSLHFYLHHATSWHVRITVIFTLLPPSRHILARHLYTSTYHVTSWHVHITVIFTLLPPSRHILARTYQSSLHFYLHHATSWHVCISHLYTSTSITPHPGTYVSQSSLHFYLHHATSWHVHQSSLHFYLHHATSWHVCITVIFTLLPPSRHILARTYHSHLYTSTSITPHPGTYVSVIFTLLPPSRHILARMYHSHLYTSTSITPHPGTYVSQSSLHFYLHHATSWHVRISHLYISTSITPHPGTYVSQSSLSWPKLIGPFQNDFYLFFKNWTFSLILQTVSLGRGIIQEFFNWSKCTSKCIKLNVHICLVLPCTTCIFANLYISGLVYLLTLWTLRFHPSTVCLTCDQAIISG